MAYSATLAQQYTQLFSQKTVVEQAQRLVAYWKGRGYHGIRVTVIRELHAKDNSPIYCIRSNIGPDGFPPKVARAEEEQVRSPDDWLHQPSLHETYDRQPAGELPGEERQAGDTAAAQVHGAVSNG